jgi:hypothetical protein
LSYERAARGQADLLSVLREEILSAISKHVTVERDNVQIRMDRGQAVSTIEIDGDPIRPGCCLGRIVGRPSRTRDIVDMRGRLLPRAGELNVFAEKIRSTAQQTHSNIRQASIGTVTE